MLRCGVRNGQPRAGRPSRRVRVRSVPAAGHVQSAVPLLVQLHRGQREAGPARHLQHRQHEQEPQPVQGRHDAAGKVDQPAQVAAAAPVRGVLLQVAGAPEPLRAELRVRVRQGGRGVPVRAYLSLLLLQDAGVPERGRAEVSGSVRAVLARHEHRKCGLGLCLGNIST